MPILALLFGLGLLGGGAALALGGKKTPPTPKALLRESWYRIIVKTSLPAKTPQLIDRLRAELLHMGFANIQIGLQDPADPAVWTFIAQWRGATIKPLPSDMLTITRMEEIKTPPANLLKPEPPPSLDPGIPFEEAHAVAYALAKEKDPVKLEAFATSLLPDFPLAASLLSTKARMSKLTKEEVAAQMPDARLAVTVASGGFLVGAAPRPGARAPDRLFTGVVLHKRTNPQLNRTPHLLSANERAMLVFQTDGNLVLSTPEGKILWSTKTNNRGPVTAKIQPDGNFVLSDQNRRPIWASATRGRNASFHLQNDGNLVMLVGGRPIWSTDSHGFVNRQDKGGWLENVAKSAVSTVTSVAKTAANTVTSATKGLGKVASDVFNEVNKFTIMRPLGAVFHVIDPNNKTFKRMMNGDINFPVDLDGAILAARAVLPLIPGIGPAAGAAIGAGMALAMGESISEMAVSALAGAVPGGVIAQRAFKSAAAFAVAIAEGRRLDTAALEAARAQLPKGVVQKAFDAGLSVAQGKKLQEIGFNTLGSLVPGDLAKRAVAFGQKAAEAAQKGTKLENLLISELQSQIVAEGKKRGANLLDTQFRPAVSSLVKDPSLAKLDSFALANKLKVAEPIARAALSSVKIIPKGARIVNADMFRKFAPNPPAAPRPMPTFKLTTTALGKKVAVVSNRFAVKHPATAAVALRNAAFANKSLSDRKKWVEHYRAHEKSQPPRVSGVSSGIWPEE